MKLSAVKKRIEGARFTALVNRAFSSVFFPLITAIVVVGCYYLQCELVTLWYFALCVTAIFLLCKDVTPVFVILLFMPIFKSMRGETDDFLTGAYLLQPRILPQIIVVIALFAVLAIFRIVTSVIEKRFRVTPMFIGVCAFAAAMILNASFTADYNVKNLMYGAFIAALYIVCYMLIGGNVEVRENTLKRIAIYVLFMAGAMLLELAVAYLTYDGLFVDGSIERHRLYFGWGSYNTFGVLACLGVPAAFYLAVKCKFSWPFLLAGVAAAASALLSFSRQAMLCSVILFVACSVWLLVARKGKDRIINASILGGLLVIAAIIFGVFFNKFYAFFEGIITAPKGGSGRDELWALGWNNFLSNPVFGSGFYAATTWGAENNLLEVFPHMYHNTIIETLGGFGLAGFVTYVVHRTQTLMSLFKRFNSDRVFIMGAMLAVIVTSLLDNHLFYAFPAIIYVSFVALLDLTENKTQSEGLHMENEKNQIKADGGEKSRVPHKLSGGQKFYRGLKAFLDFNLALILLILLSPLFVVVAIAIKIDSKGPVFFVQTRIGMNGKPFKCIKFRSMAQNAKHEVASYEYGDVSSYITKVGKFIRKTSIDELPQLFCMLTGKMSLIGFRPAILSETDLAEMRENLGVYQVRPGLSGWAQVNGRDILASDPSKKAEYDAEYVRRYGFGLDVKIFFMTFGKVFKQEGVNEGKVKKQKEEVKKEPVAEKKRTSDKAKAKKVYADKVNDLDDEATEIV